MVDLTEEERSAITATMKRVALLMDEIGWATPLAGLTKASGFLRRELGRRIRIHSTPQLHFVFDASLERGMGMDQLIREAVSLSDQSQDKTED